MGRVESDDVARWLRENKPRTKKEKIRSTTAMFYAAGYGLKEAKKRAILRVKTKTRRRGRSRKTHTT